MRAIEGEDGGGFVHDRFDVDRATPDALQVGERVAGVVVLQFNSLELVLEEQLTAVSIVAVGDVDERSPVIGQAAEQLLLDLWELPRGDFVGIAAVVVSEAEQLVLEAELRRQVGVDERHVIVNAANLEDFLAT